MRESICRNPLVFRNH